MTMTLFSCNKSTSNVANDTVTQDEVTSDEQIADDTEEVEADKIEDTSEENEDTTKQDQEEDANEESTGESSEEVTSDEEKEPEETEPVSDPKKEEPTAPKDEKPQEEKKEEEKKEVKIPDSFDPEFYASHNPDVVAAFGNSPEALYNHYKNYGKKEGRSQNAAEEAQKQANQQAQAEQQTPVQPPAGESGSNGAVSYTVVCDTAMLDLINQYRAENGLPALSWNSAYEQVAKDRIKAIGDGGVLSHDAAGGIPAGCVAENLFQGSGNYSTQIIFDGYKNSPGHNANMLSPNATSCVIATVSYYKSMGGLTVNAGQWNIQIFF